MVSNFGNIKSLNYLRTRKERLLKPQKDSSGYLQVNLSGKLKFVQRLVAETFLDKKDFKFMSDENRNLIDLDTLEINHKDENPLNNQLDNLEWCTHKYNCNYNNHMKKIVNKTGIWIEQYDLSGNFIKRWKGLRTVERILKISCSNISECCKNRRKSAGGYIWKYAEEGNVDEM